MPVCSFFLKGICTRENCPYIHVCVGRDAEICPEFIRGYCPLGEEVSCYIDNFLLQKLQQNLLH